MANLSWGSEDDGGKRGKRSSGQASLPRATEPDSLERAAQVVRLVESQIIPRLMLAHGGAAQAKVAGPQSEGAPTLAPDGVDAFAWSALERDVPYLMAEVERLLAQGSSLQSVYRDVLAPAARRLGVFWAEDEASFAGVTLALGRLQQVVHELSLRRPGAMECRSASLLLAPAPGEQHTFGLVMVEDSFRRAGWRTAVEPSSRLADITAAVAADWYDVFGFSVGCDRHLDRLGKAITQVRRHSLNPALSVVLGGRVLSDSPDLADGLGADGVGVDAQDALALGERLVQARQARV
jgi:methanogenic corrinoid protein MtbC1